eukprot:TRINITY_DN4476_c1_g2_i1.p1 TRINITY_DN4476_c1_g2~~TRINITY_DN4476_c1_g2_i1.p1  ORF type:complete len:302 (+),score=130.53 TRINITY_DN4476_c1_g2_i1:59-907(+)
MASPQHSDSEPTTEQLAARNAELRAELLQLNKDVDRRLHQRGESVAGGGAAAAQRNVFYESPVVRENERARKINQRLAKRLHDNQALLELQQLQNAVTERRRRVRELSQQNQTLEQVGRLQGKGLDEAKRFEDELQSIRRTHAEDVHRLKEELRTEKKRKDAAHRAVITNQSKLNALRDRIAQAQGPMAAEWQRADQRREELEQKRREVTSLTEKVEDARRQPLDEDTRGLIREKRELTQQAQQLQRQIDDTKVRLAETDKVLQMSASPYLWKYQRQADLKA